MNKILISHFYNEEYLLPWWLQHHVPLFDHGILINRGSTDRSVELCRQLAPHWEVRDSKVPLFDPPLVDHEVMEVEQKCSGWKMSLNTTEFLCVRDKEEFYSTLEAVGSSMYYVRPIELIDDPNYGYKDPDPAIPLVKQRFHGYIGESSYGRFIHKLDHGHYTVGRHQSTHPSTTVDHTPAFVFKFIFSPWTEDLIKRKLQITPTMAKGYPPNMGGQHFFTREQWEEYYLDSIGKMTDLRFTPEYKSLWGEGI